MGHFCINRSGKNLTVTRTNGGGGVIGTIKPNEVFVWIAAWSGNDAGDYDAQQIFFKRSDSEFVPGWVSGVTDIGGLTPLKRCSLYDIDIGYGNGVESVFQTRSAVKRYDKSGKYVNTISANSFVTTKNATCGSSNRKLMHISSWGPDGGEPTPCDSFIDVCASSMQFNSFALKGELR